MEVFLRYYKGRAGKQAALGSKPHSYNDQLWAYPRDLLQTYVADSEYQWFVGTLGSWPAVWFAITKTGYAELPSEEAAIAYAELTI